MKFDGFITPTKNWFPMPNNWTDITAEIKSLAELKVVEYVMRHTWGYHEYGIKKTITTDEFMHGRLRSDGSRMDKGTGLSNRSVIDGLRAAEEHGYLVSEIDTTDLARQVKSYAPNMAESDVKNLHSQQDDILDVKNLHSRCETSSYQAEETSQQRVESSHRSEKETIERNYRKKPKKEKSGDDANASHRATQNSHVSHNAEEKLPDDDTTVDDRRGSISLVSRGDSDGDTRRVPAHHIQADSNSYSPTRQPQRGGIDGPATIHGDLHHGSAVLHSVAPEITTSNAPLDPQRTATTQQQVAPTVSTSVRGVTQASDATTTGGKGDASTKPARKPTKAQLLASKKERIDKVYKAFNELGQEVTGNPDFHYSQFKKTTDVIAEWLDQQPTPQLLRTIYLEMAHAQPDPRSGFSWSDHLSIESVIRQCDRRALAIQIKQNRPAPVVPQPSDGPRYAKLPIPSKQELERTPISASYAKLPVPPMAMGGVR